MNIDMLWPSVGILLILGSIFFARIIKFGGFKNAMFGARIVNTLGEAKGIPSSQLKPLVRVHSLQSDDGNRSVGLEVYAAGTLGGRMMVLSMSVEEASRLSELLSKACK